ncbi:uncharacterized protein BBA_01605 [Beauveria bassiana ARSEF 2860]|uniref:Fungal N-terminal domain-containing protein n=1 Tax=Beauveria bassiana (strain ARSEF 2860) TaxID=655819 RepID=J4WIH8_BEAB2|nr:uncharacterized protein BBA_01605 [Beauveria bassiana ARSEF 2860]EJP69640.1 hypothetical protein BBA_01605 [Beauveria bassiana ARSEF 2860]
MADPLSVAGLAFAVVSLGLQVTAGITDYFDALNSRDQDIASARQQNDTLRKTLRVIESSSSRLQNDHRAETAALRECLDSCKQELQALESTVTELISCDQATTCRKDKIRNQGKRLLYPFNRPKLEQITTRLHNINSNLQLALQNLGLAVSQLGTERLATLEATSHTISTDLLNVQSEILAMTTPLQSMHSNLSRFETRFDGLENLVQQLLIGNSTTNGTQSEATPLMVTGRLLSKPGLLQETCDAAGAQAWQRSDATPPVMRRRTSQFSKTVSIYTGGRFSCFCRCSQPIQRKSVVWSSFSLSLETAIEQHLPGCPATQAIPVTDRRQKISLTYVGFQSLLNLAIQLSFMVRSGAGGWSLGSNFTYYPLVDSKSAPAFRMLFILKTSLLFGKHDITDDDGLLGSVTWQERMISSVVSAISRLFRTKKASPRAVDAKNRSLVYGLAECVSLIVDRSVPLLRQDESSPLLDLLRYLLINKAPASDYDIYGETPLSIMLTPSTYGITSDPLLAAAAELLLRSNTENKVACLSRPELLAYTRVRNRSGQSVLERSHAVILSFLAGSAKLAEVELLLRKHPTTLSERNLFGHTPLHLAADKLLFLRLLVKVADARLLNQADGRDGLGLSVVETAVSLSKLHCREDSGMCKNCSCDECAVTLLEADCALPVSQNLQDVLASASERCKLTYARHMKDRRDRLKQLALENLSIEEVERLGLASESLLDSHASEVTQLLQGGGIAVPAALAVVSSESLPVYHALYSPKDAEIFFNVGFRDTDAWSTRGMAEIALLCCSPSMGLGYLHWLSKHGGISCQPSVASTKDVFAAHLIFLMIGFAFSGCDSAVFRPGGSLQFDQIEHTMNSESPPLPPVDDRIASIRELHTTILPADIADACHCQCFSGGCTPLKSLLKGAIEDWNFQHQPRHSPENRASDYRKSLRKLITGFILYLEYFWCHLEIRHHITTLRFMTYTALEIPHSCSSHCPFYMSEDVSSVIEDELKDEQASDLELLEELLHGFEGELIAILQDPDRKITDLTDFWKRTWTGRMAEVLAHLEGCDLSDEERRAAEGIGLVWNKSLPEQRSGPRKVGGNPYRFRTWDFWMYELEKTEAKCQ